MRLLVALRGRDHARARGCAFIATDAGTRSPGRHADGKIVLDVTSS
jgi:hypothetical protein